MNIQMQFDAGALAMIAPLLVIGGLAFVVLLWDVIFKPANKSVLLWISLAGIGVAAALTLFQWNGDGIARECRCNDDTWGLSAWNCDLPAEKVIAGGPCDHTCSISDSPSRGCMTTPFKSPRQATVATARSTFGAAADSTGELTHEAAEFLGGQS